MLSIVMMMLLQPSQKVRTNKKLLLSNKLKHIGVGIEFHWASFYLTIVVAEDFECVVKECLDETNLNTKIEEIY